MKSLRWAALMGAAALALGEGLMAQDPASLDSLVADALVRSPTIVASQRRVDAARATAASAGSLDDPMLMLGLMNQPIRGSMEDMTMRVLGVTQMIPFPGKRPLGRAAAAHELAAAQAELEASRRALVQEVKEAYYELAFVDRTLEVLRRNDLILGDFIEVTEARYGLGTGSQLDVLEARVELAQLAAEAVALQGGREAALAGLNAALDRPTEAAVVAPRVPERIARAAVPADPRQVRFTSAALGSRAAGSPLPPLAALQEQAIRDNPELLARDAMIAAQATRLDLARKAHLPDLDLSLQYGQRDGLSDLISAVVSLPIPVRRGSRQDREREEAEATLAALQAERRAAANEVRAEVARAYADSERARSQLALFVTSILPQGRAALESATSSFQVGRGDFLTLLENQATLYGYETAYHRALTDFAIGLAKLERLVGREIL